jgi:dimethylhistidine N-methyltransferase
MQQEQEALQVTDLGVVADDFASDVVEGLRKKQKSIPSKYFYDRRGSQLFDRITQLQEYYPTRTEISIMERYQDEIDAVLGPRALIIEYGSGSSTKTRLLLDRLIDPVAYMPIDISKQHLLHSASLIAGDYPDLEVLPVVADYTSDMVLPEPAEVPERTVVYFPGSTIGNFEPEGARDFLSHVASVCGPGGGLLIGVDLVKDTDVLEAAYNDSAGITAKFNLNLLHRINAELGAEIDVSSFEHLAFWSPDKSRIEMHLRSRIRQSIRVADVRFDFKRGETIHTENSHKFTIDGFAELAEPWFTQDHVWTDDNQWFSLQVMARR